MYAVIFRARINRLDDDYVATARQLRELAMKKYGCLDFTSAMEDGQEIAISWWRNENDIARWKQDPDHLRAQQLGRTRWYESYSVEIVEIKRRYRQPSA
jgi:heme-degrading monooxygenase HmoA